MQGASAYNIVYKNQKRQNSKITRQQVGYKPHRVVERRDKKRQIIDPITTSGVSDTYETPSGSKYHTRLSLRKTRK